MLSPSAPFVLPPARPFAVLLAALVTLPLPAACAGRYAGTEHYTSREGVPWSCREPAPHPGGTCRPETQWPR